MATQTIYRVVIEGGKTAVVVDSFFLFFCATDRLDASERLDELTKTLFGDLQGHYEAHGLNSRDELYQQAIDAYAFKDAYLVECGSSGGKPRYIDDAIIFAVGYDRVRITEAFELGKTKNRLYLIS